MAGEKPITVELIQQIRSRSREQDLHRLLFAAEDGSEFRAVRGAEQPLGEMTGMLRDERAQRFTGRIRRDCRTPESAR